MGIRVLERSDLDFATHLTVKEGWNYTSLEIGRMLRLDPNGSFVYEDAAPLGFVTSVTYGRTGVLGHLIVSSDGRGRGIGNLLTAAAIGRAIGAHFPQAEDVIVCGGGAYNATLVGMLADEVAPRPLRSSAEVGVAPQHVEALAFAWLAREFLARRCGNLPAVTGAEGPRVLGCLYPGS